MAKTTKGRLKFGELRLFPLESGRQATIKIQPAKQVNMGAGARCRGHEGSPWRRGRTLARWPWPSASHLPVEQQARVAALTKWFDAVGLYPTC